MQQLDCMVNDPARRQHMKCLSFSTGLLKSKKDDYRSRQHQNAEKLRDSRETRSAKKDQMALHAELLEKESLKVAVTRVREAIRAMRQHGINVGISCRELCVAVHGKLGNPEDPAPWGYDYLCDALGYRGCIEKRRTDFSASMVVVCAMMRELHAPSTLELGNYWNGVRVEDFGSMLATYSSLDEAPFRNLVTLRLSLTLGYAYYGGWRWRPQEKEQKLAQFEEFKDEFFDALLDASQLKTLALQILPDAHDHETLGRSLLWNLLDEAVDSPNVLVAPKLRELSLDRFDIEPVKLLLFVMGHRETLDNLYLRNIEYRPLHPSGEPGDALAHKYVKDLFAIALPRCRLTWIHAWDGEPWARYKAGEIFV